MRNPWAELCRRSQDDGEESSQEVGEEGSEEGYETLTSPLSCGSNSFVAARAVLPRITAKAG